MAAEAASFEHILCAVDFSDESRHALEWAIAIARTQGSRITLLTVCPPPALPYADLPIPDAVSRTSDIDEARQSLAPFVELTRQGGVPVTTQIESGQPANAIVGAAGALGAGLIVLGTHGRGGFDRLLLGSVAEKVLRRAGCAVLTVPPRAQATALLPFKRILCPVDFSEWSLKALSLSKALAQPAGAAVTALHVIEWPWEEPPPPSFGELPSAQAVALHDFRRSMEQSAMARLRSLTGHDSGAVTVTPRIENGRSYERILHVAAEQPADLIVIGVHGRAAADLLLFGSTTNHVVRRATCPVLTLRG